MRAGFWLVGLGLIGGCSEMSGGRAAEAEALVQASFDASSSPGRVGVELLGKGVWYRAPMLSGGCLQSKQWAFNSDPRKSKDAHGGAVARISPTYAEQRNFVTSTDDGYCVFVGSDPKLEIKATNYIDGVYRVETELSVATPGGWWDCMSAEAKVRTFEVVEGPEGALELVDGPVSLGQGGCPAPLPGGEQRTAGARPRKAPPKLPTAAEVAAIAKQFDGLLHARDHAAALKLVSCFNLFEESKYGTCSTAEIAGLAPMPRAGEMWMEPPWTDGAFDDLEQFSRIFADKDDKAMAHVTIAPKRGGASRTMAMHWVDGEWKLVGVVGAKGEGLTSMRFVYDLDRKEKREIFERRLAGEPIDEKGFPLDPFAKPEEEGGGPTEITF